MYVMFVFRRKNLKTQQSPIIFGLCLRKTREVKSRDYRDFIVLKKLSFKNAFCPSYNEKPAIQIRPV